MNSKQKAQVRMFTLIGLFFTKYVDVLKTFILLLSWKRALGVTSAKQKFARQTGIPTTKSGLEKKIGSSILKMLFGKK